jgi:beta-1,4-mannosyltransferase
MTEKNQSRRVNTNRIAVVVLGDLDRSPRMINHAMEASLHFEAVTLIGYRGTSMPQKILDNEKIEVTFLSVWLVDLLRKLPRFLYLFYAFFRLVIQTLQLMYHLTQLRRPYRYILIQNPPCIPLLLVAVIVCIFSCGRTRLVVDWHNYGFSILEVGGSNKFLVKIGKIYEVAVGRLAWKHLTVSKAMKKDLIRMINVPEQLVYVVYDRATSKFKSLSQE